MPAQTRREGTPKCLQHSRPVKDQWVTLVGTKWLRKVVITHRNGLTPVSPWVSAAHASQVSLNQEAFAPQQECTALMRECGCSLRGRVILCFVRRTESVFAGETKG